MGPLKQPAKKKNLAFHLKP
ncbi:hypothetical protein CGLO_06531 [Colletotrichum gloeosporioides Cg-14]|uniref:Uncharacterized protein n=1 Tax=Colletotrichum gloeosporioides (strain Cg-14) TaxID=1237896 RepID=T0KE43_COLGC|nr:hypothetical protein CGLO_06531 [Colletotrichum gloeosporioides Cg-14]